MDHSSIHGPRRLAIISPRPDRRPFSSNTGHCTGIKTLLPALRYDLDRTKAVPSGRRGPFLDQRSTRRNILRLLCPKLLSQATCLCRRSCTHMSPSPEAWHDPLVSETLPYTMH